ncbi:MAG: beta-ketoacyl synthase chain length factor [Bacteroidales bacterium]|jgi:3-oxoacyl-[acyl-carrier-protein] synthase II|nr:beta-ketoacyl synthase chain length factor [Bacteroidales bacterium]
MDVYIKGIGNISPQNTIDSNIFLDEIVNHDTDFLSCIAPNYKEFINPIQLRRMSKLIKMGISASKLCLTDAGIENPGAIITGTGLGLVGDTEKFLNQMLDNNEEFLAPTAFIQSTHNTISGQVAIALKCFNYNNTYSHRGFSFESALLDGMLLIKDKDAENVLVGGFDEITPEHYSIVKKTRWVKKETIKSLDLLDHKTPGTIVGEGVGFFSLTGKKDESNYAKIKDIKTIYKPDNKEEIETKINQFLTENDLTKNDIDLVVLGINGNVDTDDIYYHLADNFFNTNYAYFKHLSGDYHTVGTFALWFAANTIKHQKVPEVTRFRKENFTEKPIKNVLVYNHFREVDHSILLLTQ